MSCGALQEEITLNKTLITNQESGIVIMPIAELFNKISSIAYITFRIRSFVITCTVSGFLGFERRPVVRGPIGSGGE